MSKIWEYINEALDWAAIALTVISIAFFVTHNVADAIYFMLGAVLINQRGRVAKL